MASDSATVNVRILERDYQVVCRADERDELHAAAEYVDRRMKEVRQRGNVIGTDRVAVMAALNIAHDLLALQESANALERVDHKLEDLTQRLQSTLSANG